MTQQTHPAVQALLDGVNNGDADAFLGCFTEDGVVDDWGREFRGAARIRAWSDTEFIGARAMLREAEEGWPSVVSEDLDADEVVLDHGEIAERMSGNLCRCAAYANIVPAIAEVARS